MKKIITACLIFLSLGVTWDSSAQGSYTRWGVFGGIGVNNINGSVETEHGTTASLKGKMSMAPTLGLFYEAAADKNLSVTFSAGFTYTSFAYSYIGKYNNIGFFTDKDTQVVGVFPDGGGEEVKRSVQSLMVTPQAELNFITNPIFKQTTCLEFRLGLGAAIYTGKKNSNFGELVDIKSGANQLTYYYNEKINMGNGNAWGNTYGSLYIGFRWRNTTSNFLNNSTLGLQILAPFNSNRGGGVELNVESFYWNQNYQTQTAKFRLNTIGLKYSYSLRRNFN